MKNKQEKQVDWYKVSRQTNRLGTLPPILADKKVFAEMTNNERVIFYKHVQDTLPVEYWVKKNMIQLWCLYPEKHLRSETLKPNGKRARRWFTIVAVLEHVLTESVTKTMIVLSDKKQELVKRLDRINKRLTQLNTQYEIYNRAEIVENELNAQEV